VFNINTETCNQCGDVVKVIANIEDQAVIKQILDHLENRVESSQPLPHPARAQPQDTGLDP